MNAADSTKQVIDVAMTYTKQIVEALTPIAKQAYEIGLLTLRIDAAQDVIGSLAIVVACFFVLRKIFSDFKEAKKKAETSSSIWERDVSDHLPGLGVLHFFLGVGASVLGVVSSLNILSLWVWVKLFNPELWLAHQAVEKLLK